MTLHVFPDLEQGSEEWLAQRRGIVTASVVGRLVTSRMLTARDFDCPACGATAATACIGRIKRDGNQAGAPLKSLHSERAALAAAKRQSVLEPANGDEARNLTMLLVAERITGSTESGYINNDMLRGTLCEPIAREAYAKHHAPVDEVGFMRRDEDGWTLGVSPDGVVGEHGLIEIKAPRAKTHIATILADEVPAHNMPQCQAALLASGRAWLDFVSFYGGLPLYVKRVLPDPQWFTAIESACRMFETTVSGLVAEYEARSVGRPATERVDFDLEIVI